MLNKLAIVIPAYKDKFFEQTLKSIASQTVKDFTLYIGDDSTYGNMKGIVDKYRDQINIVYKKFENNLGGNDLVAQWERCIDLVQNEEWIWLFSDDDIMSEKCVEGFYETLHKYDKATAEYKIFKFNLSLTDTHLNCWKRCLTPSEFNIDYFLQSYFIEHTMTNRAVEFIFSKNTYKEKGGYVNFPLGWGSDTATMLKFGQDDGFVTMVKGDVLWRSSDYNISGINNQSLINQKAFAYNQYYLWIFDFIQSFSKRPFFYKLVYTIMHHISGSQALTVLKERSIKDPKLSSVIVLLAGFIRIKRFVRFAEFRRMIMNRSRETRLKVIS